MARARNIKPGICKNEDLARCTIQARYLSCVLPCFADREGRLEDRPLRLKIEIFPADDGINVDALLNELQDAGFVLRYEKDNTKYIQIVKFKKHQSPHVKEQASTIPAPDLPGVNTSLAPPDCHDSLIPGLKHTSDADAPDTLFEELWAEKPNRPNQSKQKTRKAYNARMREKVPHDTLLTALRRYNACMDAEGRPPDKRLHLATFIGPERHFELEWAIPHRVPDDIDELRALVVEKNITVPDDCGVQQARKIVANQLGMTL